MDAMLIVQRRDARKGQWVDTVERYSRWNVDLTARRNRSSTGHNYVVAAAHSGEVLEIALARELGSYCSLDQRIRKRPDHGISHKKQQP